MQDHSPTNGKDSYKKFVSSLPADLTSLKALLEWYVQQSTNVIRLLNEPTIFVNISYQKDGIKRLYFHNCSTAEIKHFLSSYSSRLCAEKLMLEVYIEEVELLQKQMKYN